MIHYDPATLTVVMDLTDLEHCGFNHDDYFGELLTSGMSDETANDAQWPVAIMVNFAGGYVMFDGSDPEGDRLIARKRASEMFAALLLRAGVKVLP